MNKVELPNRLSALLRIAVEDAQKIEKTPGYVLDMTRWHAPDFSGPGPDHRCRVCLAGSVMAHRLNAKFSQDLDAEDYSEEIDEDEYDTTTRDALWAIDSMRQVNLHDALLELGFFDDEVTPAQKMALGELEREWAEEWRNRAYLDNGDINPFFGLRLEWSEYLAIADRLEGIGL